jgi:hypothetical protein
MHPIVLQEVARQFIRTERTTTPRRPSPASRKRWFRRAS